MSATTKCARAPRSPTPASVPFRLGVALEVVEHQIEPSLGERERDALADAAPPPMTSATGPSSGHRLRTWRAIPSAPDPEADIGQRHGPSVARRGPRRNRLPPKLDELS